MSSLIVEVVKVDKLFPHPNADTLSIAQVKGWNCIVKNGEFNIGDLAVYIPIDSVLPQDLIKQYNLEYLKKGERVRTIKLRGFISQGLLLPVPKDKHWKVGQDVAKELGITKWEPPTPNFINTVGQGSKRNPNPYFKKYTDIENIKNYPDVFKDGDKVVITEKIHGTNFRCGYVPMQTTGFWSKIKTCLLGKYEFVVGSHNVQLDSKIKSIFTKRKSWYKENVYIKIAEKYKLDRILPKGYILFGEIYGKGIQDLTYGLNDIDVVFFDLMINGKYVDYFTFRNFCQKTHLPIVPYIYHGSYTNELVNKYTSGNSLLCPAQIREGIVIKDVDEINDPKIGRKILKSISEDYLLRKNGTEYR